MFVSFVVRIKNIVEYQARLDVNPHYKHVYVLTAFFLPQDVKHVHSNNRGYVKDTQYTTSVPQKSDTIKINCPIGII